MRVREQVMVFWEGVAKVHLVEEGEYQEEIWFLEEERCRLKSNQEEEQVLGEVDVRNGEQFQLGVRSIQGEHRSQEGVEV
jgi:hypothetical protein